MNLLAGLGRYSLSILQEFGRSFIFEVKALVHCVTPPFFLKELSKQMINIGFYCLPIVGLTAIFAGMVLALQTYIGCSRFNAESAVASVLVVGLTRELGPLLAGLMVTGRMSSSIAAEIGSMRVTEQIDALRMLRVNPFKFLVAPRVLAGITMLPFLVLIADIVGIMGGFLVATTVLDFSAGSYINQSIHSLEMIDVISGLVKASVFGFVLTCFGCYEGYYSDVGARGVGNATTNAVVSSSICILVLNYLLTALFFGI